MPKHKALVKQELRCTVSGTAEHASVQVCIDSDCSHSHQQHCIPAIDVRLLLFSYARSHVLPVVLQAVHALFGHQQQAL